MHIITRKRLIEFAHGHPDCVSAIESWHRIMKQAKFKSFVELPNVFPSADLVGKFTVFNIGGNKARLIVAIHYIAQRVYIRHVLTHAEYDRNTWQE